MPFVRKMRPVPLRDLRVTDPFWSRWQRVLVETTLPAEYEQLQETGRLENFRRAARKESGTHEGLFFNDSDVYKWAEAASYALAFIDDRDLTTMLDEVIELIVKAQEEDGYLNTFFQLNHPDLKWRNLAAMHEMYCAGHLIEAGVAHYEATRERKLLDAAIKAADHVLDLFGPQKKRGYCGHQELELALVRLAESTGENKYAELAWWMVEERGKRPSVFESEIEDQEAMKISPWLPEMLRPKGEYRGDYAQDHVPIREQTEVVGHAVRAMYFYAAATDLADGRNDAELEEALQRIWANLTGRRMYITGGVGPSAKNEGFTADYDLPNHSAYAETCAALGLMMWGRRLLEMTGDSEYADVIERALYNGALSGVSLGGDRFFYTNPLESRADHERVAWFKCACCPPNIARTIASVGQYAVSISNRDVYIHIPMGVEFTAKIQGVDVRFDIKAKNGGQSYPWHGSFTVSVQPAKPVKFALKIRIPDWADEVSTDLPGSSEQADYDNGYAVFDRAWNPGDVLTVDLDMYARWNEANPKVLDDLGRVALNYGPIIYCLEEHDCGVPPQAFAVDPSIEPSLEYRKDLLEGVNVITVTGYKTCGEEMPLYEQAGQVEERQGKGHFIPFFAWCNRGPNHMQVWVRR